MANEKLPYEFNDKYRQILFRRQDLPNPWINYLSNGRLHAFVSQAGGGMCWWKTPQNCRLTRYRFYNLPIDSPGFYVYIKMTDGTIWSPTFRPCETKVDYRSAYHTAGSSTFIAENDKLRAILTLFMAPDYDTLIWKLQLENGADRNVECDVFAYCEFSQFAYLNEVNLGYYLKWQANAYFDDVINAIMYKYNSFVQVRNDAPIVYFSTDEKVDSFCCNRDLFCGNYRDERNPVEVENGILSNSNLNGGEPCAALHSHVLLNANEHKTINYYLGVAPSALKDYAAARDNAAATLKQLKTANETEKQYEKNNEWWSKQLGVYQCDIPDKDAERQINTWNPIQSVVTARFSRSISSSASGIRGTGFRDSSQDMLAQAYRKPEWAADMLRLLASQQFEDGHTVHTFWPEDNKPPQDITRSDNHLWMIYLAYAVAAESGDIKFLDTQIPYLGQDMKPATNSATLWEHLLKGIEFTENHLGEHGLPLILFSDWNDHLGPFGRKGKGETVFVAQQFIYALKQLSELAVLRGESAEYFDKLIKKQQEALNKYAWDGEWYLRGFDDDGNPIGSHTADYAKIWVNTQSWNVIAGEGSRQQDIRAMDSVKKNMDTGLGLLINYPSLPENLSNGLPAGYSENGGVFCQANCWAVMAEALLGGGNNAWKYYKQIIPHEVIKKIGVQKYQGEPYAYSSTMLGPANEQFGQACVSQVTGTAAWMDVVSTQYLLGIRPQLRGLVIDPCIPSDWKEYTVKRIYRGCELTIEVDNPDGVQHGVKQMTLDGIPLDVSKEAMILPTALTEKTKAFVKVIMG